MCWRTPSFPRISLYVLPGVPTSPVTQKHLLSVAYRCLVAVGIFVVLRIQRKPKDKEKRSPAGSELEWPSGRCHYHGN